MTAEQLNEKLIRIYLKKAVKAYVRYEKSNPDRLVDMLLDEFMNATVKKYRREVK
jgi:hypothetical protein